MSLHQWEDAKSQAEQQQQQLSSKSIASISGANQRRPIISLLKLKSYMPLHQTTSTGLFNKAITSSSSSTVSSYKDFYANHHRLARGKVTGLSTNSSSLIKPEADTPTREVENYNSRLVTNQVVTAAQQELAESIVDATAGIQSVSSNPKTVASEARKEAEGEELGIRVQRQDRSLVTGERKLKRTDTTDNGKSLKYSSRRVDHKSCISKHNMTPSSLLLLQNHNYIEHQRIPPTDYSYGSYIHQQQQQQQPPHEDEDLQVGHSRVSTEDCSEGVSLNSAKQSNDQNQSITEQPSDSTPSLMLPNSSQFKHLGRVDGNTSGNSLNTNSSANLTDYHTNSDLNLDHNHANGSDHLTVNRGNSTPQQNYHPNLTSCDPKTSSGVSPFLQYGTSNRSTTNEYQPNFQPLMVEHQVKLENSVGRSMFEEGNSIVVDHNNIPAENSHVDNLDVPRNLAQHQAMNSINQYYNSHYNSMPTSSSKSTSPTSSTSTPSPKIATMHLGTSQHPNQLVPSAVASSQAHMDHLNQHYMSSNIQPAVGNQNHHVNQQYSYHQPATNGLVQHPLSVPVHDQTYSHHAQQHQHHHHQQQLLHQQQHHQQHQQIQQHQHQHLQHQHQQQNQQQQHLQQQQHQNMTNQHSIYHHLTNNAGVNVDHIYGTATSGAHYQAHLHHSAANQQSNHIMSGNHQNHLNTAAACAAAVVSQTLKTVANHHGQHQYGGSIANGFGTSTGSLMNVSPQNHAQFHPINPLNTNTLDNQTPVNQQQHQQTIPVHHTTTIVTRKYQCKMCPQVFMSKAEMKYHNQNHMREAKPYKCLQCAKAFANSSYLSQHMRIHQGVKPYTCDICSRKFTQLSHLQQHKRTHTGDKPYKCNYMNCTKQFSQLSNLQSHSRCHQLDKPYKCNSCYKCFHDEQSLLEHIPRHLESKHLKKNLCIFCGSSYQQERGLVKHFQQYHTDKSPTLVAAAIAAGTTGNTALIASLVSTSAPSNVFVAPSSGVGNCGGSSSSSSTTSSLGSSGNLNIQNNHIPPHSTPISRY